MVQSARSSTSPLRADCCTPRSEGRTRSLNENAHKTHVRCPGQRVVRAHKHTGSKKNVDHLINICMRYFIFQFMHLIATQMKAINLICTQITFLLFSLYKSKEKLPRQPVQRRTRKRAAAAPAAGGRRGGGRSLPQKLLIQKACAWTLFSAHGPRSKHFFCHF